MRPRSVAVLVRSHNDRPFIAKTLHMILAQRCSLPFAVFCCDDSSDDGTAEIIRSLPEVRLIDPPAGKYMPGRTLNRMVRESSGDIVVFNNADAVPENDAWLENLIRPLLNGRADAVYANQLPRRDARRLVRKDSERAFGDGHVAAGWDFFFSLASSAVFRADLTAHPFDETFLYSEDVEWAHRRKIRIVYAADSLVEHSHNYTFAELKRRFYGEGFAAARIFGGVPSRFRTLGGVVRETLRDALYLFRHPAGLGELPGALPRRWIQRFQFRRGASDYWRGGRHD